MGKLTYTDSTLENTLRYSVPGHKIVIRADPSCLLTLPLFSIEFYHAGSHQRRNEKD
jgi:hypothetical protein